MVEPIRRTTGSTTCDPAALLSQALYVEVLRQNYVVAVVRADVGLPLSFRVLRLIFPASVLLMLSWIPRMVVLLFFPQWVDPACSPVYCHRKLLVSRAVAAGSGAAVVSVPPV